MYNYICIAGLAQDGGNPIANSLELQTSCAKSSIYYVAFFF